MNSKTKSKHSLSVILIEFLGSMNLAVTLLVAIAIASVIGTVLRQNEPYQNYLIKFGPFWFDVFRSLGFYDLYGAVWFLLILGFLLVSTSVCIYRNAPHMLRDMRHFRENAAENSLKAFHHKASWTLTTDIDKSEAAACQCMKNAGYRLRRKQHEDRVVIAAMKGSVNRLGYIFTHVAIVVICFGGLIDANVPLKVAEMAGQVVVETRDVPVSKLPASSILSSDNNAFRGSITLPEGSTTDFIFLNIRDGYLVQKLPFRVELKNFRIEHYESGQPKSFESDLIIHDEELAEPLEKTIAVNHPLIYKGYAIYQASFGDGGSKLKMRAWPLYGDYDSLDLQGSVNTDHELQVAGKTLNLELTDFKLYNIFPVPEGDTSGKKFINHGPSFTFKVRDATGKAYEYVNYMSPVKQQERYYLISGVRGSPAEDFRYLHIPIDSKGSVQRFMKLRKAMYQDDIVQRVAVKTAENVKQAVSDQADELQDKIETSIINLINMYAVGGFEEIASFVEQQVPAERRDATLNAYLRMLQTAMAGLYVEVLREEGVDIGQGIGKTDLDFFDDALTALGNMPVYGSPFYLQLTDFTHVEASGLQITRAPGKSTVYFGCVMLIVGVFLMFYTVQKRFWVQIKPSGSGTEVLLAGSSLRNTRDFYREFDRMQANLARSYENLT